VVRIITQAVNACIRLAIVTLPVSLAIKTVSNGGTLGINEPRYKPIPADTIIIIIVMGLDVVIIL